MNCSLCQSNNTKVFFQKQDPHLGFREYYRCSTCQLIFLSPKNQLSLPEEKAVYDLHENSPDNQGYIKFLRKLTDQLTEKLKPCLLGLDFGCGPGPTISGILKEKGHDVRNYDPIYFPEKSLLNQTYDFITCAEVVEHLYNPRQEFQLLNRLLRRDESYLGIMTEAWQEHGDFESWWYHREPTHVCFYQRNTFEWIANWLGWTVEFPGKNVVIYSK